MNSKRYQTALSRDDISKWLVHFTKPGLIDGSFFEAGVVLRFIINSQRIKASTAESITRYYLNGAACFYDVPPQNWIELIKTNPSGRQPYGVIVSKAAFWARGGRPAIYTENPDSPLWPSHERFRLITTALNRAEPIDWTHEREWRVPSDLVLDLSPTWWWPCVATIRDAITLFRGFSAGKDGINLVLNDIYVIELNRVINRKEVE